ncbi:MAG: NAD(+) diphosphatase [Pseudomonadota bacterium]
MLQTPASFVPLLVPQVQAEPMTFVFQGQRLLLREADLALPDVEALALDPSRLHPVGLLGARYCQVAWFDADAPAPPGHVFTGLRALFGVIDDALLGVAARAAQIAEWARTHRFCGACATPMAPVAGERCFRCPACQMVAYPRISPAMMVLIRKGDQVLLALHTQSPSKRFTPLAGFLEAGESIEEAVHREVAEEVGLRIENLRYFSSQSWPFPHSLMIAFTADYAGGEIRIDPGEIAEARWFGPHDVWPERVPQVSISNVLVDAHRPK